MKVLVLSMRRGQQGEVRRNRLSERKRVVALHETQELNVNGELTL
jgi:hypothetical protein